MRIAILDDFQDCVRTGRPGFAALDVFEREPIGADEPLLALPQVLATPHLGYVDRDSYELYFGNAFDHVLAYAAGAPTGIVNPEALRSRAQRA